MPAAENKSTQGIGCVASDALFNIRIIHFREEGVEAIHAKTVETYDMVRQLDEFINKNKQTAQDINAIISQFSK